MRGPVPSQMLQLLSKQISGKQVILALIHLITITTLVSALEQTLLVISGPVASNLLFILLVNSES